MTIARRVHTDTVESRRGRWGWSVFVFNNLCVCHSTLFPE